MDLTDFIVLLIVGAIAGGLADFFVGGVALGLIGAILVGIIGAFIGTWLFTELGITIASGLLGSIIVAFVGAVILLLILRALSRA